MSANSDLEIFLRVVDCYALGDVRERRAVRPKGRSVGKDASKPLVYKTHTQLKLPRTGCFKAPRSFRALSGHAHSKQLLKVKHLKTIHSNSFPI